MKEEANEEPTRWTSVGWQSLLILNRLRNQRTLLEASNCRPDQQPDGNREAGTEDSEEQKEKRKVEYVSRRISDLAEFERRASGK